MNASRFGLGKPKPSLDVTAKPAESRKIGGAALLQRFQNRGDDFIQLIGRFAVTDARLPSNFLCDILVPHSVVIVAIEQQKTFRRRRLDSNFLLSMQLITGIWT
jgi:hypothetical protein